MIQPQLFVGIDVGCHKHSVAIADSVDFLEEFEITHDTTGFQYFFSRISFLSKKLKLPVVIGMEGTSGYARPLDQMILMRGYKLLNINNYKLARFKEIFPSPAKTDEIDAQKIVMFIKLAPSMNPKKDVLQQVGAVPEENQILKRLSRRRRQLVTEKIVVQNRIQADLQAVSPGFLDFLNIDSLYVQRFICCRSDIRQLANIRLNSLMKLEGVGKKHAESLLLWQKNALFSAEADYVGPMIIEDAERLLDLYSKIQALEKQMEKLLEQSHLGKTINSITGFGTVCAAEIAGEIGAVTRFNSEAGLAIYLGMAPLDRSSGKKVGTKDPVQVNKRAKAAMMIAAAHNARNVAESKKYYQKKVSEGKKHNQALRSLGRHLVRVIWSLIKNNRLYDIKKINECKLEGAA